MQTPQQNNKKTQTGLKYLQQRERMYFPNIANNKTHRNKIIVIKTRDSKQHTFYCYVFTSYFFLTRIKINLCNLHQEVSGSLNSAIWLEESVFSLPRVTG